MRRLKMIKVCTEREVDDRQNQTLEKVILIKKALFLIILVHQKLTHMNI